VKFFKSSIGKRMREIRENEGFSLQSLANDIGITKSRLAAYESGRNRIRFDIGLRFCRRMIVNEEWFATGKLDILKASLLAKGFSKSIKDSEPVSQLLKCMCMDLAAEDDSRSVPPECSIEEAFSKHLLRAYERLAALHTHVPRIAFTENDSPEYLAYFMSRMLRVWMEQIYHVAGAEGIDGNLARRMYLRACFESTDLIFKRFILLPTPEVKEDRFNFLRIIANNDTLGIGPLSIKTEKITG